jgi:hypothetical protein
VDQGVEEKCPIYPYDFVWLDLLRPPKEGPGDLPYKRLAVIVCCARHFVL